MKSRALICGTIAILWLGQASAGEKSVGLKWNEPLQDITNPDPASTHHRAESVEFLPDGSTVVTAGVYYDGATQQAVGEIRLFDASNGRVLKAFQRDDFTYNNRSGILAVSPNGRLIATAGRRFHQGQHESVIDVWDIRTGERRTLGYVIGRGRTSLAFSPDGRRLAAARGQTLELWDVALGNLIREIQTDEIWSVAFAPNGSYFAAGGGDGIRFWDAATSKEVGQIRTASLIGTEFQRGRVKDAPQEHLRKVERYSGLTLPLSLQFSSDGSQLAAAGLTGDPLDNSLLICNLTVRKQENLTVEATSKRKLQGHHGVVYAVAFSPAGKLLASGSQDTTIGLWNVRNDAEMTRIAKQHTDFVYDVAFSPQGNSLVSCGRDALKCWTINGPTP